VVKSFAAAALVCMAAAGCASSASSPAGAPVTSAPASSPSPAPTATASTPGSSSAAAPACPTSTLQVKLGPAEGYAGGVDETIIFTSTASAPCTLYGYPGVSLVTGSPPRQIGLAAKRDGLRPVRLVTLAPGESASAVLQIVDAMNFPASTCRPVQAASLKVYPPNQTAPVYLASTSYGCANSVQTLFVSAVQSSGRVHPLS